MQVIEHNFLHVAFNLLHLPQDHAPLALYLAVLQFAVLHDVRDDLYRLGDVAAEAFGVEHSLFAGCVGVQVCSHVLNLKLQVGLAALIGALK